MINIHLFIFLSVLFNYLGMIAVALYNEGTIFIETYIGTYYMVIGSPFFFPLSYLILYLGYRVLYYALKWERNSLISIKASIFLWVIFFILGFLNFFIGMIPFLVFTPFFILYDFLVY